MKTKIAYASVLAGVFALAGCPDPLDPFQIDAHTEDTGMIVLADTGTGEDAGRDTGVRRDTGATAACGTRGNIGGPCASNMCFEGLECSEEISRDIASVRRDGTGAGRPYPARLYPGGICSRACDPNANGQCNDCSTCLQTGTNTAGQAVGECFMNCTLDIDGRSNCPTGYACDRGNLVCVPECTRLADGTDTCQFSFEDRDGMPGNETIVDEGPSYPSMCNTVTGLCESMGRAGATAGDDCMVETDCEDNGFCLSSDPEDPPTTLSDGYCIRVGCDDDMLPCQTGDVCSLSLFGLPGGVCMDGCTVGSEANDAQRFGPAGGNPGCGPGEACFWDGVHGMADTLNGACFPGNYNDVPAYNVGAECQDDEDCWSPFGLGRCLFSGGTFYARTGRGICAIGGCGQTMAGVGLRVGDGVVSVPDGSQICQIGGTANDLCVGFSETTTFCVSSCTSANDCPTGYACPDLSGDPLRPLRLCWPACTEDSDCRTGARCRNDSGLACNPDTDTCFCTDAMPAPDAGPVARDAAVTPDAATTPDAGTGDDAAM